MNEHELHSSETPALPAPFSSKPADTGITISLKTVELAVLTLVAAANIYFGFSLSSLKKPDTALAASASQTVQAAAPAQQNSGLPSMVGGC